MGYTKGIVCGSESQTWWTWDSPGEPIESMVSIELPCMVIDLGICVLVLFLFCFQQAFLENSQMVNSIISFLDVRVQWRECSPWRGLKWLGRLGLGFLKDVGLEVGRVGGVTGRAHTQDSSSTSLTWLTLTVPSRFSNNATSSSEGFPTPGDGAGIPLGSHSALC